MVHYSTAYTPLLVACYILIGVIALYQIILIRSGGFVSHLLQSPSFGEKLKHASIFAGISS